VFQVSADWGRFMPMNKTMEIALPDADWFRHGFRPPSPRCSWVTWANPDQNGQSGAGYVYFGPVERLHRNTTIPGFVTDAMFEKYKDTTASSSASRFNPPSRLTTTL